MSKLAGSEGPLLGRWLAREPNPLWLREMIQSSRLTRTPLILMTITILLTVITCSVGGIASSSVDPTELGSILFHVFFSLCYAVVCWIGPGVGTLLVSAEHSHRTWEALVLTGLSASQIARGKYLAALTYVGMYLVMLAPIGAVAFVAGGVSAWEVIWAFVLLVVFGSLAVGFGIAVGSSVKKPAPAMMTSIVVAVGVSFGVYLAVGVFGAALASEQWRAITAGAPVWLPTAYTRAPFSLQYFATLVFAPLTTAIVVGWLFFEVAVANMGSPGDDRLFGLKRWLAAALPLLTLVALTPRVWLTARSEVWLAPAIGLAALFLVSGLSLLILAGDDIAPSKRVLVSFERDHAGPLRRFLGPGISRTVVLVLAVHAICSMALLAMGYIEEMDNARVLGSTKVGRLGSLLSIACASFAFLVFVSGLLVFVRSRSQGGRAPRLIALGAAFVGLAGPWLLLAIAGLVGSGFRSSMWVASPSPLFCAVVIDELLKRDVWTVPHSIAQLMSAGGWTCAGVALWILGQKRLRAEPRALPHEGN